MSSFFKRPSWAKHGGQKQPTDFYHRSAQLFTDIVEDQSYNSDSDSGHEIPHSAQKSREAEKGKERDRKREKLEEKEPAEPVLENTSPAGRQSPCGNPSPPSKPDPANLGSPITKPSNPSTQDFRRESQEKRKSFDLDSSDSDEDLALDDEDIPGLKMLRDKVRQRSKLSGASASSTQKQVPAARENSTRPLTYDPSVQILITSTIENTKPLLVHRRLSQNLGDVRKAWCSKQGFDLHQTSTIILTWNGHRVIDTTTCRSLDIMPSMTEESLFSTDYSSSKNALLRLHVEASYLEVYERQKRQTTDVLQEQNYDQEVEESLPVQTFRITLRTVNSEDLKIKVHSKTKISYIIDKFRSHHGIPSERSVDLHFDGERLNPDSLVEHHDIDYQDCIDVVVKG